MSENSNTFQVSLEGERSSVPTYNEFETELMSTQDHVLVVGDYLRKPLVSLSAIPGFDLIKQVKSFTIWCLWGGEKDVYTRNSIYIRPYRIA